MSGHLGRRATDMSNTLEGPLRERELFRNADQTPRIGNHYLQNSFRRECVPQLVSAQAAAAPDAIAVTHGKKSLTYQDLDRRSDRLAHYLRSLGVGPDVVVGLCIGRSIAVIVGALRSEEHTSELQSPCNLV